MNIRQTLATSIAALALIAAPALHASPLSIKSPIHAAFGKTKTVSVSFHNASAAPLELKVGDNLMTVAPGQTLSLHLAAGTRVLANSATAMLQAGALITEVAPYLDGATLNIN
jgi:hypothetical protein